MIMFDSMGNNIPDLLLLEEAKNSGKFVRCYDVYFMGCSACVYCRIYVMYGRMV